MNVKFWNLYIWPSQSGSVKYPAISNWLIFEGWPIFKGIWYAKHKILIQRRSIHLH